MLPYLKLVALVQRVVSIWRRHRVWGTALVVLSLVSGVVVFPPAYRSVRSWRASQLAEQAVASLESGDVQRASELAAASLQLESNSVANRRLFAEHFDRADPESALLHGHALATHPEAKATDLRRYIAQCMDRNFAADSVSAMNRLLELAPEDASNWVLAGEYERSRGNAQEALNHVDRALALSPNLAEAQWLGATLALESTSESLRQTGRERLWVLSEKMDSVGLRALSQLTVGAELSRNEIAMLTERLEKHPLADISHWLAGEQLRFRSAPTEREQRAILDSCAKRYGELDRPMFLAWLNRVGQSARVLDMLSLNDVRDDRDLFLTWCEAMLEGGRERELLDLLDPPVQPWPIRESTQDFLALEAARRLSANDRAQRLSAKLMKEAEKVNPPISLISLAQRLETKSLWQDAKDVYLHVMDNYPGEQSRAYDRLAGIAREQGDSVGLLALSERMRLISPDNPIYQHNWAYLSMLRNESTTEAVTMLRALAKDYRLASSVCATAVNALRNGYEEEASREIEALVWDDLSPLDQRWVRWILMKAGVNRTNMIIKPLRLKLFPEEKLLLGPVVGDDDVALSVIEDL